MAKAFLAAFHIVVVTFVFLFVCTLQKIKPPSSSYSSGKATKRNQECEFSSTIGVARGCSGCTCTPRVVKKNFSDLIYRKKVCKCTPQDTLLGQFLLCGLHFEVDLDSLQSLRATTKKGCRSSIFFGRKVHPRQNPGYAYVISGV